MTLRCSTSLMTRECCASATSLSRGMFTNRDISRIDNRDGYFLTILATKKPGSTAERLRAFVRQRVHKDGDMYQRGAATTLAKYLGKPSSWVSHYIDKTPDRHASLDEALAICDYFGVYLSDF